jgi:hypothetical protein
MCRVACCRAWRWSGSTAGDSLAVRHCCCRGCETQHRPAQLASSPVTLSVMGKGDRRGHVQRADGKSTLGKRQDITTRIVKFTRIFHTHYVSQNNSVYTATGQGLKCLRQRPDRLWSSSPFYPIGLGVLLSECRAAAAWSWPFIFIWWRGQEWRSYNSIPTCVFMAWILINTRKS